MNVLDDVDNDIRAAIASNAGQEVEVTEEAVEPSVEPQVEEAVVKDAPKEEKRNEKGQFKGKLELSKQPKEEQVAEPVKPSVQAPASLSPGVKAKWNTLPAEVQTEWAKRENDIHQMFTRHDGELRMGREMKEIITPYLATIQAEGGTPAKAVQSLLNTAYQLRTASPQQKALTIKQIMKEYNVDPSLMDQEQEYQDPTLVALQNQNAQLQSQVSPEAIKKLLQEQMESVKIDSEVLAFASDPANIHYEQVKPIMASLLGIGRAKNLNEAYDMACMATPDIRATLLAKQSADEAAKRKNELASKKRAGVSVSGSPGASSTSTQKSDNSVEDDVREAMRAASGRI